MRNLQNDYSLIVSISNLKGGSLQGHPNFLQKKIWESAKYPDMILCTIIPLHPFELRFADALHSHNYKPILNTMLG